MQYLKTFLISLATTLAFALVVFYFVPFDFTEYPTNEGYFGTTVTEISGTDKMSDFPTSYNATINALNAGKIEISTTSLPLITTLGGLTTAGALATVGTIGTGVWQATDIGVAYGGTGASTFGEDLVLLGNGTGALKTVTTGSNDQVLTLVAGEPAWTSVSVDKTLDYDWTGNNTGVGIVGEVIAYASSSIPVGWLSANGASVSTTTYSRLFAVIGYTYGGSGDTFSLPNLSGRNIIGYGSTDTTIDTFGETGGATSTALTEAQMPSHTHSVSTFSNSGGTTAYAFGGSTAVNQNTGSTGGDEHHPNLDPFIVLQYIIKY